MSTDRPGGNDHPDEWLPWYANGTLEAGRREAVEAHLAACARCRAELELLSALRKGVKAAVPEQAHADELTRAKFDRLLREERRATRPAPRFAWWQPALAAAVLVIVVQSVLLIGRETPGIYAPLGGPSPAGAVIQVQFNPAARERDIRRVLRQADLRIVGGPSALGIYRLRLAGKSSPAAVDAALRALRAHPKVVSYAARE